MLSIDEKYSYSAIVSEGQGYAALLICNFYDMLEMPILRCLFNILLIFTTWRIKNGFSLVTAAYILL